MNCQINHSLAKTAPLRSFLVYSGPVKKNSSTVLPVPSKTLAPLQSTIAPVMKRQINLTLAEPARPRCIARSVPSATLQGIYSREIL